MSIKLFAAVAFVVAHLVSSQAQGVEGVNRVSTTYECYDSKEEISEFDVRIKCADSFYVDSKGVTYLLDSYNKEILVETDMGTFAYKLCESVLPCDMLIHKGNIYIFDELLDEVQVYSMRTSEVIHIPIAMEDDFFKLLEILNNDLCIRTYKDRCYIVNLESKTIKLIDNPSIKVGTLGGFSFNEVVGLDFSGHVYSVQTVLADSSIISGDIVICKQNNKGEVLGYYVLPPECVSLPTRYIQVDMDGDVYVLRVEDEVVIIEDVQFTETLEFPERKVLTYSGKGSRFGTVKLSREQVLERSLEATNIKWALTQNNVRTGEDVRLPRELEYLAGLHKAEGDWKETCVGIPYCWGGFCSLKNFKTSLTKYNNVAGNIDTSGFYKGGTTGLDCSGYVSLVYGLSEKYSTRTLFNISKPVKSLKSMDMLVAPGDHVILYCDDFDGNALLVNESTARDGKVLTQVRSLNWFVVNGKYQMRSPWK